MGDRWVGGREILQIPTQNCPPFWQAPRTRSSYEFLITGLRLHLQLPTFQISFNQIKN
ncbi:hypothetical protein PanWU01x14_334660 [Parasponia andersonii]|uniref:Uncharacterized protein n=1 Tax=Parasponia andersonii TaxID=3476 RepID=A0A2P5AGF8_PARAD|nr:hypothetical protein PanWU01x14_334660 [Parasponia andersonii]